MMYYPIKIFYSEEDKGFIAVIHDLPGCSAYGETENEAIRQVKIAQGWGIPAEVLIQPYCTVKDAA